MKDNDLISRQSLLNSLKRFVPEHFNGLVNDLIMKEPSVSFSCDHENDHIAEASKKATQTVITCDGCRFVGTYDTDLPCCGCVRREKDYYEPER